MKPKLRIVKESSPQRHFKKAYKHTKRKPGKWRWGFTQAMLATIGLSVGGLGGLYLVGGFAGGSEAVAETLQCPSVRVIDGDTFDCGGVRIRMHGIDSPEMPGHCRPGRSCTPGDPIASTANLERLMAAGTVQCRKIELDPYGRTVARCMAGETDLSCAQIEGGYAVHRYGMIWC